MPDQLPLRDRVEIDVVCDGVSYEQAFAEPMEKCGFKVTTKHTGVVTKMAGCLEMMFTNIGDENAEQA